MAPQPEDRLFLEEFPLFSHEDYDFHFHMAPLPIGLKSTYPEELKRRIAAANISFLMGYKGIDRCYNNYTKNTTYPDCNEDRLDLLMDRTIKADLRKLDSIISETIKKSDSLLGNFACEWTFLRVPFSSNVLLSLGHRGALFEALTVARMLLEQIAWAANVHGLDDLDSIQNTSASHSVSSIKKIVPNAGRLYGWLSSHAHWAYDAHIKAMHYEGDEVGSLFASSRFKARSFLVALFLSEIAIRTYCYLKIEAIAEIYAGDLRFDDAPSVEGVMEALWEPSSWKRLLDRVLALASGSDDDLISLAALAPSQGSA